MFSADSPLPFHADKILSGEPRQLESYLRELVASLNDTISEQRRDFNGTYRQYDVPTNTREYWTPEIFGVSTAGVGTYTSQVGYVRRTGIMVDVWFDVIWTGHTGTGNMYLQLPYKPTESAEKPFVGVIQDSNITYTAGTRLVINAIPDTFRGEIWTCGDGVATGNQAIDTAGQLIGYIRYIGQRDEQ